MKFISILLSMLVLASGVWASNAEEQDVIARSVSDKTIPERQAPLPEGGRNDGACSISNHWAERISPGNIAIFHLPLEGGHQLRPLDKTLRKIAEVTGNPTEFMISHANEMSRVPLHILREDLNAGFFKDVLQQGPFYTEASRCYYQVESLVEHEKYLYLDGKGLALLPPQLWELTELRELALHRNCLTFLPDNIGNLHQLTSLSLFNNSFHVLPKTCVNLINLEWITLSWYQWIHPQNQAVYKILKENQRAAGKTPVKVRWQDLDDSWNTVWE